MKKFFPDRKHASILTYVVSYLFIASALFLSTPSTTLAAQEKPDCQETTDSSHTFSCVSAYNDPDLLMSTTKTYYCAHSVACSDWAIYLKNNPVQIPVTVCSYAGDEGACTACLDGGSENGGIWTALGCIHYGQDKFILELVKIIMGVAGFISLAMMLVGSVIYMTGGGNPEQLKRGKELFTGAIVGLLFLIFSVVILQIITKDIIKIDL